MADDPEHHPATAKACDAIVLAWWRTFPADSFGPNTRRRLSEVLDRISAPNSVWRQALQGDAASAVHVVLRTQRVETITSRTDLMMTALARCALEGSAGAALVLAHALRVLPLENREVARRLGASWLVHNLASAFSQKSYHKVSKKDASRNGAPAGSGRVVAAAAGSAAGGLS
jgi:hypothetical protein